MAGREWGQQEQRGFAGGPLGYPWGKSEQDARYFGAATLLALPWSVGPGFVLYTRGCKTWGPSWGDCSLFVVIWGMKKSQQT